MLKRKLQLSQQEKLYYTNESLRRVGMWDRSCMAQTCFRTPKKSTSGQYSDKQKLAPNFACPPLFFPSKEKKKSLFGDDLLSQGVTPQVPSALMSLTAGFEM